MTEEYLFISTVRDIGNSYGIIIPANAIKSLDLKKGDELEVKIKRRDK